MAANQTISRRINDRRLYILAAVLTPIIVVLGFARTYYLRGLFSTPPIPSRLVHLHGMVMTLWVILFVTQVALVSKRRIKTHQRLGIVAAVWAGIVFVVGIFTGLYGAARGASPGPPALQFLVVPLGDMLVFGVLIGVALHYRRRPEIHKRLMLLAAVNLLAPAIARIPIGFIERGGPVAFYGLTDLLVLGCVAFDTIKHRRVHPVFFWSLPLIILSQPLRLMLAGTDLWLKVANTLVSLVN